MDTSKLPFDPSKIISRLKSMFMQPKAVWSEINAEEISTTQLIKDYYLPLAIFAGICVFIGSVIFGIKIPLSGVTLRASFFPALLHAIAQLGLGVAFIILGSKIVAMISAKFEGSTTENEAAKVLVFATYPALAAQILGIIPILQFFGFFFAIFSLFLLYQGFRSLDSIPEAQQVKVFLISLVAIILSFAIIGLIVFSILPNPYPSMQAEILKATSEMSGNLLGASSEDTQKIIDSLQRLAEQGAN